MAVPWMVSARGRTTTLGLAVEAAGFMVSVTRSAHVILA